jgi:ATP-dependent exoDNAse (exonuclease V) alpha subunit
MLYRMIKASGGECLYRKVDYAFIRGGSLTWGEENGDYRPSDLPLSCKPMREESYQHRKPTHTMRAAWKKYSTIRDSDQYAEVFALLEKEKALLNTSRAGTGKTWASLKIEELFREKYPNGIVVKMAPTNKAAIVMGGQTIHRALQMDSEGRINLGAWSYVRHSDTPALFLLDEVSMITGMLWQRLVEVKRYIGDKAYFMLSGDPRQLPPVEAEMRDYFNSSAMKYMANNNQIEFVVRKRYDEALWGFAEQVDTTGAADLSIVRKVASMNPAQLAGKALLCYTNRMRKSLNMRMNEYLRPSDAFYLPYQGDGDKQQDAWLYAGMPVMAHTNNKKLDVVNNEDYVVESIGDKDIVLLSQRPEGEHRVTCRIGDFHETFVMAYASTIHKQQGATIDNDIVVFEWGWLDRRLRYTAVTRAKKLSQISVHEE